MYRKNFMNMRSEEHTSELQSLRHLVCRILLEKNTIGLVGASSDALTQPNRVARENPPRLGSGRLDRTAGSHVAGLIVPVGNAFFFLISGNPPTFPPFPTPRLPV